MAAASERRPPPDLMTVVTSIGSPIALATALLFYFGWVRSEEQAQAFGADASVFAMSTNDYLLRSVNILFFPVMLLLLAGLLAIRVDRRLRNGDEAHPRVGTSRDPAAVLLGVLPARRHRPPRGHRAVRRGDAAVLGDAGRPRSDVRRCPAPVGQRGGRPAPFGVVVCLVALVVVCLFWQTERLASLGGEALAEDIKDHLDDRLAQVEVFSAKDLQIDGPG